MPLSFSAADTDPATANVTKHVPALMGKIQGAVYCCERTSFDENVPAYVKQHTANGLLGTLSYHRYPVNHCDKEDPPFLEGTE